LVEKVRLALNVAACDRQPLVVIRIEDSARRAKLSAGLATLAWSREFVGKFVYVAAEKRKDLDFLEDVPDAAVIVIDPDTYGLKGKTLAHASSDATPSQLVEMLKTALSRTQRTERNFW